MKCIYFIIIKKIMTNQFSSTYKDFLQKALLAQDEKLKLQKQLQLSAQLPKNSSRENSQTVPVQDINSGTSLPEQPFEQRSASRQLVPETAHDFHLDGNSQVNVEQAIQLFNQDDTQVRENIYLKPSETSGKQECSFQDRSQKKQIFAGQNQSIKNVIENPSNIYKIEPKLGSYNPLLEFNLLKKSIQLEKFSYNSVSNRVISQRTGKIPLRREFNLQLILYRENRHDEGVKMPKLYALKEDSSSYGQLKNKKQILYHEPQTHNGPIKPKSLINHLEQTFNDQVLKNLSQSKLSINATGRKSECFTDLTSNFESQLSSEENDGESQDESQDSILNEQSQDEKFQKLKQVEPQNKNLIHKYIQYQNHKQNKSYQHFDNYMTRYTTTGNLNNNWHQSKPIIRKLKYESLNLAFAPKRNPDQNNFYGMSYQERADFIIDYIKILEVRGTDLIAIQEWGHKIMQQKLLKALRSGYLKFYYPVNLVQNEPFSTIILSRRKVKFGQFRFDINCQWDSIQTQVNTANCFCEIQVQINKNKQTFMFMSNHSRARRGEQHFKDERKKQHDAIWLFSQSYHHSFIAGDWNVGTQLDYQNENKKLNKYDNMVDFAYLQCAGKNGNKEKTYIKVNNEGRTFTEDRLDRVFCISDQYKNKPQMKKQIIGTVTSHDEIPEINKGYKKMQFLLNTNFSMYITLSDHSFINGQFGLKSKK